MKDYSEHKPEFKKLITELLEEPSADRECEIMVRLGTISPDPNYPNYIYNSEEYENKDGTIDVEAVTEKVFKYEPILL